MLGHAPHPVSQVLGTTRVCTLGLFQISEHLQIRHERSQEWDPVLSMQFITVSSPP
jgi:hypothetical protein